MPEFVTDPDKTQLTEIELEQLQQARLMDAFIQVKTYDARESIILACERLIQSGE
jgi:hypothetical protein